MRLIRKKVIFGCESRGDADSPYLTRWRFWERKFGAQYLHLFHRSDHDVMHDHPWWFVTFILWRGYIEETPAGRRRLWPLTLHFRPAKWVHRVELIEGKPALTLVLRGSYTRQWGFHTPDGWVQWREYFERLGC